MGWDFFFWQSFCGSVFISKILSSTSVSQTTNVTLEGMQVCFCHRIYWLFIYSQKNYSCCIFFCKDYTLLRNWGLTQHQLISGMEENWKSGRTWHEEKKEGGVRDDWPRSRRERRKVECKEWNGGKRRIKLGDKEEALVKQRRQEILSLMWGLLLDKVL